MYYVRYWPGVLGSCVLCKILTGCVGDPVYYVWYWPGVLGTRYTMYDTGRVCWGAVYYVRYWPGVLGNPVLRELHTEFVSSLSRSISWSSEDRLSSPRFKSSSRAFPKSQTKLDNILLWEFFKKNSTTIHHEYIHIPLRYMQINLHFRTMYRTENKVIHNIVTINLNSSKFQIKRPSI